MGGVRKNKGRGTENKRMGVREGAEMGLTIRAQKAHFTHTSSKPMEFALVAVERGKREGEEEKDFDSIWQPETPSHSLYQKGREAWSVQCHKINTDTKSKETEIKRVIDVEGEKVKKKTGTGESRMKKKEQMQRG